MAKYTENYGFTIPEMSDEADISVIGEALTKIDASINSNVVALKSDISRKYQETKLNTDNLYVRVNALLAIMLENPIDEFEIKVSAFAGKVSFGSYQNPFMVTVSQVQGINVIYTGVLINVGVVNIEVNGVEWLSTIDQATELIVTDTPSVISSATGQTASIYVEFDVITKNYTVAAEYSTTSKAGQAVAIGSKVRVYISDFTFDCNFGTNKTFWLYEPETSSDVSSQKVFVDLS